MRLSDMTRGEAPGYALVRADAAALLHGAVRHESELEGWIRPWRFSADQMRAMGSCQAWHPGLYRQMGRATAGVCLEFTTDSSEVAVEVRLDGEPVGTREVLKYVDAREAGRQGTAREAFARQAGAAVPARMHDGLSCEVDGRPLGVRVPAPADDQVTFTLDDPSVAPAEGVMQLPGMGDTHHVRVWLPCLRGCTLRSVVGNGSFIDPVEKRRNLLVLGDSIAQGFVVDDPALAWPTLLAAELGLDVVNQGVGGQVFQPGTLYGLAPAIDPAAVVVALGANYRYEPCRERLVTRDVRSFLEQVARLWEGVPTWVATPLWHDEDAWPSHRMSCFEVVPRLIREQASRFDGMRVVDGAGLLDHDAALMADGFEHPGPAGSRQVARRLGLVMEQASTPQEELRERALSLLAKAPRRTFVLAECLRRGVGSVICARPGCVALREPGGMQMVWATDRELAKDVACALMSDSVTLCLEPSLADDLAGWLGLPVKDPVHLAIYRKKARPRVDAAHPVRPLGPQDLSAVRQRMTHPEYQTDAQTLALLGEGNVLGAFAGGELVGFVGEQTEGSMGMLEVFEDFRRHGWALALESAKICQVLDRGQTPWCEVWPDNVASVRLQRKLGLTVLPATEACFLAKSRGSGQQDAR
ncbi:GDSL-type esterase/lipase family protein [Parafannyhessea umbonata]|uniref:GDSL-type esterase/lipase family protein n=1 Tax=Parafannyhessea umbonata TaxID=604330 RepID=UPI003F991498